LSGDLLRHAKLQGFSDFLSIHHPAVKGLFVRNFPRFREDFSSEAEVFIPIWHGGNSFAFCYEDWQYFDN